MINLILIDPPRTEKCTKDKKIAEKFDLLHISTGDLFRKEIGEQTKLGKLAKSYIDKGQLVPDEVTIGMLQSALDQKGSTFGVIYDGFPRKIGRASCRERV